MDGIAQKAPPEPPKSEIPAHFVPKMWLDEERHCWQASEQDRGEARAPGSRLNDPLPCAGRQHLWLDGCSHVSIKSSFCLHFELRARCPSFIDPLIQMLAPKEDYDFSDQDVCD